MGITGSVEGVVPWYGVLYHRLDHWILRAYGSTKSYAVAIMKHNLCQQPPHDRVLHLLQDSYIAAIATEDVCV